MSANALPVLNNCLRGILVVPFVAAGITRTASHMDSNGIEQVRSSIAQWLFAFMAGDICGVALYAAQFLVFFLLLPSQLPQGVSVVRPRPAIRFRADDALCL
jgi:hypothetical protein